MNMPLGNSGLTNSGLLYPGKEGGSVPLGQIELPAEPQKTALFQLVIGGVTLTTAEATFVVLALGTSLSVLANKGSLEEAMTQGFASLGDNNKAAKQAFANFCQDLTLGARQTGQDAKTWFAAQFAQLSAGLPRLLKGLIAKLVRKFESTAELLHQRFAAGSRYFSKPSARPAAEIRITPTKPSKTSKLPATATAPQPTAAAVQQTIRAAAAQAMQQQFTPSLQAYALRLNNLHQQIQFLLASGQNPKGLMAAYNQSATSLATVRQHAQYLAQLQGIQAAFKAYSSLKTWPDPQTQQTLNRLTIGTRLSRVQEELTAKVSAFGQQVVTLEQRLNTLSLPRPLKASRQAPPNTAKASVSFQTAALKNLQKAGAADQNAPSAASHQQLVKAYSNWARELCRNPEAKRLVGAAVMAAAGGSPLKPGDKGPLLALLSAICSGFGTLIGETWRTLTEGKADAKKTLNRVLLSMLVGAATASPSGSAISEAAALGALQGVLEEGIGQNLGLYPKDPQALVSAPVFSAFGTVVGEFLQRLAHLGMQRWTQEVAGFRPQDLRRDLEPTHLAMSAEPTGSPNPQGSVQPDLGGKAIVTNGALDLSVDPVDYQTVAKEFFTEDELAQKLAQRLADASTDVLKNEVQVTKLANEVAEEKLWTLAMDDVVAPTRAARLDEAYPGIALLKKLDGDGFSFYSVLRKTEGSLKERIYQIWEQSDQDRLIVQNLLVPREDLTFSQLLAIQETLRQPEKRLKAIKALVVDDLLQLPTGFKGADNARKAMRDWLDNKLLKGVKLADQENLMLDYLQRLDEGKTFSPNHNFVGAGTRSASPVAVAYWEKFNWSKEGIRPVVRNNIPYPSRALRQFNNPADAKSAVARFLASQKKGPYAEFSIQFYTVQDTRGAPKIWVEVTPGQTTYANVPNGKHGEHERIKEWARAQGYEVTVLSDEHAHPVLDFPYEPLSNQPSGLTGKDAQTGSGDLSAWKNQSGTAETFGVWSRPSTQQIAHIQVTVKNATLDLVGAYKQGPAKFREAIGATFDTTLEYFDRHGNSLAVPQAIDLFEHLDTINKQVLLNTIKPPNSSKGATAIHVGTGLSITAVGALLITCYLRSQQAATDRSGAKKSNLPRTKPISKP